MTLNIIILRLLLFVLRQSYASIPFSPMITDPYLSSTLEPYMDDAIAFQDYLSSHPDEFNQPEPEVETTDYYVKGASWVRLEKTEFNNFISMLKRRHGRGIIGNGIELDEDRLFLRMEETNLFDGLL
ncbi:uncharacterized protein Ecym_8212 [Eremothecium cymbalariae DBVPG|uniref:Uncharacterized protein n=1 Tax=Eremothecium cymbalariae (strain CBS 270.75 / DBVPG 7215 / KCTC 17166 / NRRL Y-17582) TaxID=931890 RepID=G8JXC3_ERECY|nr:Hypothetical protein Ecym_8212 [Eremothecium cymbalariae DBVPG\